MSTLGKILTVLVALVAVAVAVLVAREYVLGTNWKALYDEEAQMYNLALAERDAAAKSRDDTKAAADQDKTRLQASIDTLTNDLDLRKKTIIALETEKVNMEKQLAELAAQYKGINDTVGKLVGEKEVWRKERDDATKRADELTTMLAELDAKYRNSQADVVNIKETLRKAREDLAALESRLAWINQNYPEVKLPQQVPAVPTSKVNGLITSADNEAKVAEINLGADSGVVKGMKFFVYDAGEMKYLATLTISLVSNNKASGELSVIRGTVKANDHVTNRFE